MRVRHQIRQNGRVISEKCQYVTGRKIRKECHCNHHMAYFVLSALLAYKEHTVRDPETQLEHVYIPRRG
jgi:GTP cyclohydrolase I